MRFKKIYDDYRFKNTDFRGFDGQWFTFYRHIYN